MELHFFYNNYIFFVSAIFFLHCNEYVCNAGLHQNMYKLQSFFNSFHALIECVCILGWPAQKSPSYEWGIWIKQGLFELNIPDQLIIGGMDIKLSPPSYKEKDDENAI